MIDVLVTYSGRTLYLERLFTSLIRNWGDLKSINLIFIINGCAPVSHEIFRLVGDCHQHQFEERISINDAMNYYKENWSGDSLMAKIDEDCELLTPDFYKHLMVIHNLFPLAIYSPYVCGLVRNPGGAPAIKHDVVYSDITDRFYTRRITNHVGGIFRVMNSNYVKHVEFHPNLHNEDGRVSEWSRSNNIEMFYLESEMVVSHIESSLGQHQRYGEEYFKGRF